MQKKYDQLRNEEEGGMAPSFYVNRLFKLIGEEYEIDESVAPFFDENS